MTNVWTKWEGLVVDGAFPLRRFLSRSDHSVVFLTEHRARNLKDAAIKLVPADPVRGEAQLACWRMDASLSHPHLIRLFDVGRCQLGGHNFNYVVMEFADQTLAQLLAHRALTADEAREMLAPVLETLTFLHRKRLVQGQLKPPNILVVNDQLKLASDTVRPAGATAVGVAKASLYDPPESKDGRLYSAGDVWALGVTLVQALTQRDPTWAGESPDTASLPASLAPGFVDTLRRCLSRNPASRPTIIDLEAHFLGTSAAAPVAGAPEPAAHPAPHAQAARMPLAIAGGGLIVLSMVWAGFRLGHSPAAPQQPASATADSPAAPIALPVPVAAPAGANPNPSASKPAPSAVLYEEIPVASRGARQSIRGRINVTIRVVVDRSGNVIQESVEYPGSSHYFTRLGFNASKKWKFEAADSQAPREWLLRFEFTRAGTSGHATPSN